MPDHRQAATPGAGSPPTPRQQAYIRRLALARGVSFTPPQTRAEASRLIDQLKRRIPDARADRRRELKAVRADLAAGAGDATRITDAELTCYGSTAAWKGGER